MIETVSETGSTNADLLARLSQGEAISEGYWLRADRQTAGRGRSGREWVSPVGNLYCSTVVRLWPTDPLPQTLSLVAGLAVYDLLSSQLRFGRAFGYEPLRLKWPNDVLFDGAKIAGILCERIEYNVVVGIGVNVTRPPSIPDRPTISIQEQNGFNSNDAQRVLEYLVPHFEKRLLRWRDEPLENTLAQWSERAHEIGTRLSVHDPQGSDLEGAYFGIDQNGCLQLQMPDGTIQTVHAGDVSLIAEGKS